MVIFQEQVQPFQAAQAGRHSPGDVISTQLYFDDFFLWSTFQKITGDLARQPLVLETKICDLPEPRKRRQTSGDTRSLFES